MLPFAIKIFSAFLSQKFQSRDFAKMIYQFFYIYSTVTTCKKSKNVMHGFVIKLKKFILGHFLSKKPPMQTFSQKFFYVNFKPLCCFSFMRKPEKFQALIFRKT